MRRVPVIIIFSFIIISSRGQTPVGSWSDHLVYNTARQIAVGEKEVFASTGSSVLVYNRDVDELVKLSHINGLTETGISSISWSEEKDILIIGYTSTNIDLVSDNVICNIPDISRKYIPGKKEINRIRTNGKYAYLACSFGIVVVDMERKEIYDTWKPGTGTGTPEIWDIAFGDNMIYAATGSGLYSADLSLEGLSYFGNWQLIDNIPYPEGKYTSLVFSGTTLFANLEEPLLDVNSVYAISETASLFYSEPGVMIRSLDNTEGGFTITTPAAVRYYDNEGILISLITSFDWGTADISQAIVENGNIWLADINSGLVKGEGMTDFSVLSLPGPVSNNVVNITSHDGQTLICGGAVDNTWTSLQRPLQVSVHNSNNWANILTSTIKDAMRTVVDPDDHNHFFVASWGYGLLEYMDNVLIHHYTDSNSPLQTIIAGSPYVRICGMALDDDKNLWITQSGVEGSIKVLKPDGTWIVFPVTIDAPIIGDIIISRSGHKWINLPRGHGLFVINDNGTPDEFSDDTYKKTFVKDADNQIFSSVYSVAEDLDGSIWVGTDQGPMVYYNPEKIFEEEITANRIKMPRDDGTNIYDYLLGTETITSIAIDGANRKWLGTFSSGAYHLSPDGTLVVRNFTEQESPLLSNSVVSIAVDNLTGDVWFGTSKGIQSFRGEAIEGKDMFSNVYAFPNPVREDFSGNVTITGLMKNSKIKITDISGNLVYETTSDGGQASWDLKTYDGRRVSTGVYLVFCSGNDGSHSIVTKMLVIH